MYRDNDVMPLRDIGIFAHVNAGKTTTSEAILYYSGRIHRMGRVDDGDTQLDWMIQERERGITVTSAATTLEWQGCRINLIDTPGHVDFSAEAVRSIRVIDGGVILLCGVGGVEPQTETIWLYAEQEQLPRILFVNKLDRRGADFARVVAEVREDLTEAAIPVQLPIGAGGEFRGVVDLLERQALVWDREEDGYYSAPIPDPLRADAEAARAELVDAICATDDGLLAMRIEGEPIPVVRLRRALRQATISRQLMPVLCGAALRHVGVQPLLDAVVAYLPSPSERRPVACSVPDSEEVVTLSPKAEEEMPLCAAVFKIVSDSYVGHLSWVRIFTGELAIGDTVYNPRNEESDRISRLYRMHADSRERIESARWGDVVAVAGPDSAATGDTLCLPERPLLFEKRSFPDPVIRVAIRPAEPKQSERLSRALRRMCDEDPTLLLGYDPETRQQTLAGMGELHLEVTVDRLRTEFDLEAITSQPEIAYRETIRRRASARGVYKQQSGGHGHFAIVRLGVAPSPRGEGLVFEQGAAGGRSQPDSGHGFVPQAYMRAIEIGVREALEKGILAGYPVTDLLVRVLGGQHHEVDSSNMDFRIAASRGVRQAIRRAYPALIEPLMRLTVIVDEDYLGAVIADIGRRRGDVTDVRTRGGSGYGGRQITATMPLAEARGYITELRSLTQGHCTFNLEFMRYGIMPRREAEPIVAERRRKGLVPRR